MKVIIAVLMLFCPVFYLSAQMTSWVEVGTKYTDNAFQLSEYDIQRYEEGNANFKFVEASDDVILNARFYTDYEFQWRWWHILPSLQTNIAQNILNPEKQKYDATLGLRLSRRLGELAVHYGYYPNIYLRDYVDSDGTNQQEAFEYAKNLYKAELKLFPLRKSVTAIEYKHEDFFYNKYFTEFDGTIDTWSLRWRQSLPTFYLDASYAYRVYETDNSASIDNSEDASYESNVYSFGLLMKKMPVDDAYPTVFWRPDFDLSYEQRYFQGLDSWHAGRTDLIYTTDASMQFYFGTNWNINLDYTHIFRNVDAVNSSVRKYKEYCENRYGVSARFRF